jgi:integrase
MGPGREGWLRLSYEPITSLGMWPPKQVMRVAHERGNSISVSGTFTTFVRNAALSEVHSEADISRCPSSDHLEQFSGLDAVPLVTLPPRSDPRQRWLTGDEAAQLLWASRQVPHLSRFIRVGLYTGTRSRALLGLSWLPSTHTGWVDLDAEIIYRRGNDQRKTNKQQTPHPIPSRLLPHLRRWRETDRKFGIKHVIHYQGEPVIKLRRSWTTARSAAGLGDDVTPHTLRHTAATWLMQRGVDAWEAAKYLGMTVETLERVYGHHHPDYLKQAKNAF